jgi:hypothetical protein
VPVVPGVLDRLPLRAAAVRNEMQRQQQARRSVEWSGRAEPALALSPRD